MFSSAASKKASLDEIDNNHNVNNSEETDSLFSSQVSLDLDKSSSLCCSVSTSTETETTLGRKPWNRIETMEDSASASSRQQNSAESGYGVIKPRGKVAKGVQTEGTRKRCWRHRRQNVTEKSTNDEVSEPNRTLPNNQDSTFTPQSSSKSTLLSALPSVNFPRWNKTVKREGGFETLVENYLGTLYNPYSSVQKQLLEQAQTRCKDLGQEFFEAEYLRPVASVLRAIRDNERSLPLHRHRVHHKKRNRVKTKKSPSGWPLCSRGSLIVQLCDPEPSTLKAGDFYFVVNQVGVSLKWKVHSSSAIQERSLDAYEFSVEMASLAGSKSSDNNDEEDGDDPERTHLLVAPEGGITRVAISQLLDELLDSSRRRSRLKCTRDSWVQTDKEEIKVASAAEETVLQPLAPLASEEEFVSDNELKSKVNVKESESQCEAQCEAQIDERQEIRQLTTISDLDQDALRSEMVIMPGCRDICSRSIVFISLTKMQLKNANAVQIAEMLLYFQSIPKRETMCLGFLAIIDGRNASTTDWCILHRALSLVEESVPGTISLVLALHFQSHKCESLASRFPIFHLKFESIVNENQLLKYVTKDQLLKEFGGNFQYNHLEWTNFHQFLDPFIASCHQMGCRLVKLIQDLRDGQLPTVLTNSLIEEQRKQIMEVLEDQQLKYLEEEGTNFLHQLEEYQKKFMENPDYLEAVEKSKLLYKQLKKVVLRLEKLANKRLNKLQECMMMKMFEEESSQVLSWLHRKGEETLKKHKTLAESLNAIREQENEFEKFYFLAMRQIERGNDLLEEIPKIKSSEKECGISATLKQQLEDFTERLEEAREKLEDTSHCYYLLDKTYEWSLETMRFVSHMKVDSTTSLSTLSALMRRLESYLQEHPYMEDAVFEEMIQLAKKLNNQPLLDQCLTAKSRYDETVQLVHTRQQNLLKTKESMTFEETPTINDSLDNLKIKPCLWNPLATASPYRTISQTFLSGFSTGSQNMRRQSLGSYTSFPSSYYPSPTFKERLLSFTQNKSRSSYLAKRGSLTDEIIYNRYNHSDEEESVLSGDNPHTRKSYPFPSDSFTNLNAQSSKNYVSSKSASNLSSQLKLESERNWKVCEDELKRYADEVREQNELFLQQRLQPHFESSNLINNRSPDNRYPSNYTASNPEELSKVPPFSSHLTRCASCSDFEELLSTKSSVVDNLKLVNNRTLKLIMMEMIQTERDYVKSLGYIIENYVPLLQSSTISPALRSQRNVIFGNIEKIYEFHNCYFLKELEQCESVPYSVGQCFLKYENQFYLYALYNKNKPKSDCLMAEYGNNFFKKKQQELQDKMDLASYLLKPVQRMGKYALLLKQLLKECSETNSEYYNNLKAAEEMVRFQLRHGNDLLAMDALKECDVNIKEQGRLLRQDEFLVGKGKSRKALRHVFLFEDLIIFSKARRDAEGHDYYQYKSSMKTSDLGLTAQVGESPTKFEIWFRKCKTQDLIVLQAPSAEIKNSWVGEITRLLWKQAERNRNLRLEEMSSMGIGNKPCLDITPSHDQICDRSISLQQLNKVPRFRNSIAVSNSDNFNNNEPRKRPLSVGSFGGFSSSSDGANSSTFYENATFYDVGNPLVEVEETENDKRRSMAQQSQCSAESGIFTDLSTSGDSYMENVQRLKTVERSDSVISRTSYASVEATDVKDIEISTTTSFPNGLKV